MRVLVTGASGQLGSFLVRQLLEHGLEVVGLVRPQSDLWRLDNVIGRIQLIHADLNQIESARQAIHATQAQTVFHLAWQNTTAAKRNVSEQITVNTIASLKLFELVQQAGCQTWIGIGSLSEYGPKDHSINEATPAQPLTAYAAAKYCTGLLTQKLCEISGIRFVWFRLAGIYGPKDNNQHLIPTVISHLLQKKKPRLTSGEQLWDYLYIEDATEAITRAASDPALSGFFCLGSGQTYSIRDIVTRIRDMIDPTLPLGLGEIGTPSGPNTVRLLQSDNTRFQTLARWNPRWTLDDGLRHTIEWHKTNF